MFILQLVRLAWDQCGILQLDLYLQGIAIGRPKQQTLKILNPGHLKTAPALLLPIMSLSPKRSPF